MSAAAAQTARLPLAAANVLLFDPVPTNRALARTALRMTGLERVEATSSHDELASLLRGRMFDLLIADVTQDAAKTCAAIRRLREPCAGPNPFLHIILMTWRLEGDLVREALNCGADDLITRPFSVDFLSARLRTHAETRKPFVVTYDYIGPDRRRTRAGKSTDNLFEVPNTLLDRLREAPQRWFDGLPKLIDAASMKVNHHRARADAFQIAFLVHGIREAGTTGGALNGEFDALESAAKDLGTRVGGHGAAEAVQAQTPVLLAEVASARTGEVGTIDLDKLDEAASALLAALNPGQDLQALKKSVAATFAAVKARDQKIA